jgi:IS30 family transposase
MPRHLTFDDRLHIEQYLLWNYSLSKIARKLGYHKSAISREIRNRSFANKQCCYGHSYNACLLSISLRFLLVVK